MQTTSPQVQLGRIISSTRVRNPGVWIKTTIKTTRAQIPPCKKGHSTAGRSSATMVSGLTMGNPSIPSPETISIEYFQTNLAKYPSCIEAISLAKGAKPGQQSLAELDRFRYGEALGLFGSQESRKQMDLADVKRLVEWKLRHGKFRPTLMSLVSSNPPEAVRSAVQDALRMYYEAAGEEGEDEPSPPSSSALSVALAILTKRLRGIGPATASLLLAVHDPARVVFFADEAFLWLCGSGPGPSSNPSRRAPVAIKYNAAEYAALDGRARALAARLGMRAVDVEKVAFVLLRGGGGGEEEAEKKEMEGRAESISLPATEAVETHGKGKAVTRTAEKSEGTQPGTVKKRKAAPAGADGGRPKEGVDTIATKGVVDSTEPSAPPLRRSKRGKN